MKLPSISSLWPKFKSVLQRFPVQLLLSLLATLIWMYLAGANKFDLRHEKLVVLLFVCNLLLTLLITVDLFAETHGVALLKRLILRFLALILAASLYFTLKPFDVENDIYRICFLAFAFHLMVSFAPFINTGNVNGFWQYNKTIFLHILTSVFYAAVLFIGLAIALFAVNGLFNVGIKSDHYVQLFAFLTAGFTTVFFLTGIPQNFIALNNQQSFPKALKIFTQYVLIPLMGIYFIILIVYEVKIALSWQLPKGLVSNLILGYAVFGILSLLLIHPIKNEKGNGWMNIFSRTFYVTMLPLIVLLVLAIVKRVGNYGITEARYVLILVAIWLVGITFYFLFSKKQNIKLIPISLCILALSASYGPQSAFSVSKFSQQSRLEKLLLKKDSYSKQQAALAVAYLVDRHGLTSLQKFTTVNLNGAATSIKEKYATPGKRNYNIKAKLVDTAYKILKIDVQDYNDEGKITSFGIINGEDDFIGVKGYDYAVDVNRYIDTLTSSIDGHKITINLLGAASNSKNIIGFTIAINGKAATHVKVDAFTASLWANRKAFTNANNYYKIPRHLMQITTQSSAYTFTFVVKEIQGIYTKSDESLTLQNFRGLLLIKKN